MGPINRHAPWAVANPNCIIIASFVLSEIQSIQQNMSLLVVGTVAFDAIETPFGKVDRVIGGSATFFSIAATFFHQPVNLVAVVGDDFPAEQIEDFQNRGVNTDGLEIRPGEKSFFWSGKYHNDLNSRDTLVTDLNVLATFNPILPDHLREPEFVMLGNLTPDVQRSVIQQLKSRPKLIALDTMNFWMDIALDSLKETLKLVDLLTINDEEARQLTGEYSLVKAAKIIHAMGPKFLVIKKGEHGALLFHNDQVFFCPAMPLEEVFDPTGAGDTFAGGMMGYVAQSQDASFENLKNAVVYGSALASFSVEKFGPERLLTLTQREIEARIRGFLNLTSCDITLV
jgi:sugar/nucleoside kinase (ribokinase family)